MSDKHTFEASFVLPRYTIRGIVLEGVQPGETLHGNARFRALQDLKCRGLWLEIGYHERGNGTPSETKFVESMIYHGQMYAGQAIEQKIEFKIPESAPITYKGALVEIEWFARIRVDIPFWFDARLEQYFRVIPRLVKTREQIKPIFPSKLEELSDFNKVNPPGFPAD